ncbi:MAG TPA: glycine--tRNA ligase subunit beta [Myxococcales bacterium]|nr:glycine--tRNA ligase subunit beta [Deltaproteobacteria bacterium]MBU54808.1 glycine--tRNA ligase subunit beta [Deltaproteobacteria bacterium]HAA59099.1 glycine--tRNA ligase subunit beta [Myxococcales bacterium]|tara:strand:- start:8292 stop:10436 length:2145 start_codon:yes stop_codon:yes gene_type:complete
MQRHELFLEVGAEEVPASYIGPAVEQLANDIKQSLQDARIAFGEVNTFGTPRRFGVVLSDVAEIGEDETQEIEGPPVRIAFDDEGNPKVPAQKFAERFGLSVDQLERIDTPKGEKLCARVLNKGVQTTTHLETQLPSILAGLSFPKTMRWGTEKTRFTRPVHWLCALFGETPLSFSFAGATSGNKSRGHRFLAPEEFEVKGYAQFQEEIRKRHVIIDPQERTRMILEGGRDVCSAKGVSLVEDPELIDLNAYLSEYPKPLLAHFEEKYLVLPDELLKMSMKKHLKCFAVADDTGALKPHFVPVAGLNSTNEEVVINGFQRVLRARLADAQHFFEKDQKQRLEDRVETLDRMTFQSKLGSYGDKARRLELLASTVAEEVGLADVAEHAKRAATLCKADLVTDMVIEFTDLQGVMGRYYALADGEPEAVAWAIEEHYLPQQQDDPVPPSKTGQVVALCDRLDTLVGGFAVGLRPSGSTDPYGLRRQTIGILRILKEHELPGRLGAMVEHAVDALGEIVTEKDVVVRDVIEYMQGRLKQMLLSDGWERDLVDAVCVPALIRRWSMPQLLTLLSSLQEAVQSGVLAGLAYSFKRVNNILTAAAKKKIVSDYEGLGAAFFSDAPAAVEASVLQEEIEKTLLETTKQVQDGLHDQLAKSDFAGALKKLLTLQQPIDAMFDHVMVMAEDEALRDARLALMKMIAQLAFVDFKSINTESVES